MEFGFKVAGLGELEKGNSKVFSSHVLRIQRNRFF